MSQRKQFSKRSPNFIRERIPGYLAHWAGIFAKKGHGAPIDRIERSAGLRRRIINMNEQHQAWYTKKFGKPDADVLTAQELAI